MVEDEGGLAYGDLTGSIINCCFAVINEMGAGFREIVYKNSLCIAMKQMGLEVEKEKLFDVLFRNEVVGRYQADLVVEKTVIVELKCCESLIGEHQAQLINYLKVSGLPVGLLVNFHKKKLEWKRLLRPSETIDTKTHLENSKPAHFF